MELEKTEETVRKHVIAILFGLIVILSGIIWRGFLSLVPVELKDKPIIQILPATTALLSFLVMLFVSYSILLKRKLKTKPNFTGFLHDPYKQCWIHKTTGQRICEACKTEGELTPLSRFPGGGWKCPIHPDIVDYPNNIKNPDDNGNLIPTINVYPALIF